ncbi:unnamed protein product [Chrysoparadoxa australica]
MLHWFWLIALAAITMPPLAAACERLAVVTGSNKGIGFEIAKKLTETPGYNVIIATRSAERGQAAVEALKGGPSSVSFKPLDISDPDSVEAFCGELSRDYPSGCHLLINNASIAFKRNDVAPFAEQAEPTINANVLGTVSVTQKLLPLLRKAGPDARVVTVASMSGQASIVKDPKLKELLQSTGQETGGIASKEELVALATGFVSSVKSGTHQADGWPNTCYGVSKLLQIAYMKLLARLQGDKVLFVSCCPGHCITDMSSRSGNRTAEEGARTPYWLATAEKAQLVNGGLYQDCTLKEWS